MNIFPEITFQPSAVPDGSVSDANIPYGPDVTNSTDPASSSRGKPNVSIFILEHGVNTGLRQAFFNTKLIQVESL